MSCLSCLSESVWNMFSLKLQSLVWFVSAVNVLFLICFLTYFFHLLFRALLGTGLIPILLALLLSQWWLFRINFFFFLVSHSFSQCWPSFCSLLASYWFNLSLRFTSIHHLSTCTHYRHCVSSFLIKNTSQYVETSQNFPFYVAVFFYLFFSFSWSSLSLLNSYVH